jgi:HD-GYP domain-containing protein (c-di-GMP phosphodiesterase class II)
MEHVLRSCLVGMRLAEACGLDESDRVDVFYATLLAWVGCHADSHELSSWFGDDIAFRSAFAAIDKAGLPLLAFLFGHLGAGGPLHRRGRMAASFVIAGNKALMQSITTHCLVTAHLATRLGLTEKLSGTLQQIFERWDGKGWPSGLRGDELTLPIRVTQLAHTVEACHRSGGVAAAIDTARKRRGSQFDPGLVDLFCDRAPDVLERTRDTTGWDDVIDAEPGLRPVMSEQDLDGALEAIGDFVDLKSPYTSGHSSAVAILAAGAGRQRGLPEADCRLLKRAGLLHDLGRLGVPNVVWDNPGTLSQAQFERVRLYPYLTERILARPAALHRIGALAALHRERLDGSGYPHGFHGDALSPSARILAVADTYQGKREPRPYRPALSSADAADVLRIEVKAGRLDGQAVDAELTRREVEILAMTARGYSDREIAQRLHIAHKTVRNHVEHIYAKIGVSSRAGTSLYAMQHGLLGHLGT